MFTTHVMLTEGSALTLSGKSSLILAENKAAFRREGHKNVFFMHLVRSDPYLNLVLSNYSAYILTWKSRPNLLTFTKLRFHLSFFLLLIWLLHVICDSGGFANPLISRHPSGLIWLRGPSPLICHLITTSIIDN